MKNGDLLTLRKLIDISEHWSTIASICTLTNADYKNYPFKIPPYTNSLEEFKQMVIRCISSDTNSDYCLVSFNNYMNITKIKEFLINLFGKDSVEFFEQTDTSRDSIDFKIKTNFEALLGQVK